MRVIEPRPALIVEGGSARTFEDRGGAGTAMRCAVFLLLRNDIPHRGPLLEDPSGRLARDGLFCAGSARCAGRAAPIVNILAGIINPRRPAKRHLKRRETGNSPRHGSDLLDCSSRCASIRRAGVRTPVRHQYRSRDTARSGSTGAGWHGILRPGDYFAPRGPRDLARTLRCRRRLAPPAPYWRGPRRVSAVQGRNATCGKKLVGVRGFEPPAPASRKRCSTRLSYTPPTGRDI
jgi:hypothetical protein